MNLESLTKEGYANPEAVFEAVAIAGGFGAVKASHGGGLDVNGIADADAKKAVAKVLADSPKVKEVKLNANNAG